MTRLELVPVAALAIGAVLILIALTAIDWRLGTLAAGLVLIAAVLDWRRP